MTKKRNHFTLTWLFESQNCEKILNDKTYFVKDNIPFTPIRTELAIILNISHYIKHFEIFLVGLKFHLIHPFLTTSKPILVDLCYLNAVCCMCSYVIQMGKVDGANATILQCSTGPGMVWWLWQWDKCVILQLNWHNSFINFAMSCCFVFIYHPLHHYSTSPLYLSV